MRSKRKCARAQAQLLLQVVSRVEYVTTTAGPPATFPFQAAAPCALKFASESPFGIVAEPQLASITSFAADFLSADIRSSGGSGFFPVSFSLLRESKLFHLSMSVISAYHSPRG